MTVVNLAALDATPLLIRRLQADARADVERFFLQELDDVSLYWRFFRTMTPMTVHAYVAQMRFENGCVVFGAFYGERLVGVAELSAIPGSEMCAENRPGALSCAELGIAVSNQLRHKGVGRTLLDYLLRDAWARGLKRIQLSSLHDNRPMLGLAARLGFKPLREESGEIIMQALRPAAMAVPAAARTAVGQNDPGIVKCPARVAGGGCQ